MRIKLESEILDPAIRKKIIAEIESGENKNRKAEAYKRYHCYKDNTNHYVIELLLKQFDQTTVEEMRYALSNISILKKVVDKLARVYSNGVERIIVGDEESTKKLKKLEKELDINTALKKTNRFLKFQKNVDLFIKPCPEYGATENDIRWDIKLEALNPFLYDVVEDYYDRTEALCVVLSDYKPQNTNLALMNLRGNPIAAPSVATISDGKDGILADNPQDQTLSDNEKKYYVFWSKNYHFTCDQNGDIIPDKNNPRNENPLKVFNHINFSIDQDGSFWAQGGNDLIDGAILINAMITHTLHVGTVQGYGQFYMTGENLPRSIKVGPTKAIIAEYKKDEQAEPKMGFLNANPQLDSLRGLIEMYVALYLTTNNLSTTGVSTQLSGGTSLPSGVALIIDKAESLEDVQDQRQVFIDNEPDIFVAINAILKTFKTSLEEDLQGLELPEGFEENFVVKFNDASAIQTEQEKLNNLKVRKELGIDSMVSLLMKDDPSLDETQAEEKLKKLVEQRIKEKMLEEKVMGELGLEYADPNQSTDAQNPQDNGQEDGSGMVRNPNPATQDEFPEVKKTTAEKFLSESNRQNN